MYKPVQTYFPPMHTQTHMLSHFNPVVGVPGRKAVCQTPISETEEETIVTRMESPPSFFLWTAHHECGTRSWLTAVRPNFFRISRSGKITMVCNNNSWRVICLFTLSVVLFVIKTAYRRWRPGGWLTVIACVAWGWRLASELRAPQTDSSHRLDFNTIAVTRLSRK